MTIRILWIAAIATVAIVLIAIAQRIANRRQRAAQQAAMRERFGAMALERQEVERLAGRIIATSSASTIAGFQIIRQIEAVFTDGHPTPARAALVAKAEAAQLGANALINLHSHRQPSGKCVASADAVIVKPVDEGPSRPVGARPAAPAETPPQNAPD